MGIGGSFMGKRSAKWLWATAIFEFLLGGFFFFMGRSIGWPVQDGFTMTAAVLGGVGVIMMFFAARMSRRAKQTEQIQTTGIPGQAVITGMRQTGMYLNEQPQVELQLQVTTQMQAAYQVTKKEYVPLMMLGTLTSGRPLPVKVDPANPQNVVIEWGSAASFGGPMAGVPMMGQVMGTPTMGAAPMGTVAGPAQAGYAAAGAVDPGDMKKKLLATGVAGTAKVISSAPTGQMDAEGRPMHSMMLEINVPGHPPMQGPAVVGIPPERAELLEPGDTVPIKADPANPSMMAVDWENA